MSKCDYCQHVEMCGWREHLEERGCDFFDDGNKWIPISERLPQKSEYGDVLVTYIPSAGTLWATVMIAQYSDLMGIAKPCFHIGEVGKKSYLNITSQVTAWMPLPKVYKKSME